jgi:hypothetical protein
MAEHRSINQATKQAINQSNNRLQTLNIGLQSNSRNKKEQTSACTTRPFHSLTHSLVFDEA